MLRFNKGFFVFLVMALCLSLAACGGGTGNGGEDGDAPQGGDGEPIFGGTINIAYDQEPLTLDWMSSDASSATHFGYHIFEQLFAPDKDLVTRPMLAEDYTLSDDGLTYTITLREGVPFHDGSIMTSADVVASIQRWLQVSGIGQTAAEYVSSVGADGDHTVIIEMKSRYGSLINNMADQQSAMMVMPEAIAKEAGLSPLTEEQLIGTGPYVFDRWERGYVIALKRFADYAARTEPWGGLAGEKIAYPDELCFYIVADPQVRVNGIKTGQYHYAIRANKDLFDAMQGDTSVTFLPSTPDSWITLGLDKSEPPFDDVRLRQAVNYAIDKEAVGLATYGSPQFFQYDGSVFFPEQGELYTLDGTEEYYAYNPDKAKQLIEASDYAGEPLILIASSNVDDHYKSAQMEMQQLQAVGFNIELVTYEWATYLERVYDNANFDLFVTGFPVANDVPSILWASPSFPGTWDSPEMASIIDRWIVATDESERKALLTELNQLFYSDVPVIKIVNEVALEAISPKVQNYENWVSLKFFNTWVDESL